MNKNLSWYTEASRRGILTEEISEIYERLLKGWQGEEEFLRWWKKYGNPEWPIFRNVHLRYESSACEIDFIILTPVGPIFIEIKNYNAPYRYKNGISSTYSRLKYCPVSQALAARDIIQRLLRMIDYRGEIAYWLLFMNDHCTVEADPVSDLEILAKSDLRDQLRNLVYRCKGQKVRDWLINAWQMIMRDYGYVQLSNLPSLEKCNLSKLEKGFLCGYCGGNNLDISQRRVKCCDCAYQEARTDAVRRTIHSYCLLMRKEEFTLAEIADYLEGQVPYDSLSLFCSENFSTVEGFKRKRYKIN